LGKPTALGGSEVKLEKGELLNDTTWHGCCVEELGIREGKRSNQNISFKKKEELGIYKI